MLPRALFVAPAALRPALRPAVHRVTGRRPIHCPHPAVPTVRKPLPHRAVVVASLAAATNSLSSLVNPTVLRTSFTAVSKLLATLLMGVFAASRGLLDASTLSALSRTVYNIFLPSLLFTNVMRTLARPLPPGLFLLPFAAVAQVAFGFILAAIGSRILRLRPKESRLYTVCAAFGNSAALPLLFANSLFAGSTSLPNLVAGISFFLLGWTGLFWSMAYSMLVSAAKLPDGDSSSTSTSMETSSSLPPSPPGSISERLAVFVKRVFTPPLIGSLLGLIIGVIKPAREMVMASPIFAALSTLATGYAPVAVLILAGSLARSASRLGKKDSTADNGTGNGSGLRIGRMVLGVSLTRFIAMPIFGMALVKYGPYRAPFVALAVLLEAVMPSAQNSTLILNMEKQPDAAASVATVLLAVYVIGVLPISVALTLFLAYTGV